MNKIESTMIAIIFWILVVLNFANVFTRYLIPKYGLAFTEDFSMLLFLWLIYFGAAACYLDNSHLGLPLFYDQFSPKIKIAITTLTSLISLFAYIIMIYNTKNLAMNQYTMNIKTSMGYPAVIGGAALPIGCALVCLRMIQAYFRNVKLLLEEDKNLKKVEK